jgi:hypothetical protein
MPLTVINGPTIAAGETLSDAIDISAGAMVRLTMPAAWTDASLTFQISSDGLFFNNLYNYQGEEVEIPVHPGTGIIFPRDFLVGVAFLRFRSGNVGREVPQPEQREFSVAVLSDASIPLSTLAAPAVRSTGAKSGAARRKTPRKTAKPRRHR